MIWNVTDYQTEYQLSSISSDVLTPSLQRAEYRVEEYITVAAFTDASAVSPTDPNAASRVKYAIGDLSLVYLRQKNIVSNSSTGDSYEEDYDGVVSYKSKTSAGTTGATPCPAWRSRQNNNV
jgi:hypothetical protein